MIPKIIHYIWLGEKKKPQSLDLAFKSWQKYALGFKIKEWSEHDIDEFNLPPIFLNF